MIINKYKLMGLKKKKNTMLEWPGSYQTLYMDKR